MCDEELSELNDGGSAGVMEGAVKAEEALGTAAVLVSAAGTGV